MICVDTSVWVEALRGAPSRAAWHLGELVEADAVLMPAPVRLELLAGAPGRDLPALADRLGALGPVIPDHATWQRAENWVGEAVAAGQRFGLVDLLIAATAAQHGAQVWSLDGSFDQMRHLGFVELYAAP